MGIFSSRQATRSNLFSDREALSESYQPDEIVGREERIGELVDALWPIYQGAVPNNVLLTGPNGVGKTAVSNWVLEGPEGLANDENVPGDLRLEWFNCEQYSTGYKLGIGIANRFIDDPDEQLSTTGHSWGGAGKSRTVVDSMFSAIDDVGGMVILILDEIGSVDDLSSLLYQITRARGKGGMLSESRLGFLGITTNGAFSDSLTPDTRSALKLRTIEFSQYDANELREVLSQRAEIAFEPNAMTDDVIPLAAAFGSQNEGDARLTLDLLELAGERAESENADKITERHIREAKDVIERDHVMTLLDGLNENPKFTVYALICELLNSETKPTLPAIYKRYSTACNAADKTPRSKRQVRNYLSQLEQIGLLDHNATKKPQGRVNTYTLKFDVRETATQIQPEIEERGFMEKLDAAPFSEVHALLD